MRTITVSPEPKSYLTAGQAIQDLGYKRYGKVIYTWQFKKVSREVYEKEGELYAYKGMSHCHYNTTIYEIYLGLIRTLKGDYEIIEEIW